MASFRYVLTLASLALFSIGCGENLTIIDPSKPQSASKTDSAIYSVERLQAVVTKVVDGDTLKVKFDDNSIDTIRILGVDTPETYVKNKQYEYGDITDLNCLDRWGEKATKFAFNALNKRNVTIEPDPIAPARGTFDRRLAYVIIEGKDFGSMLVENGYARVYEEGDSTREEGYLQLQLQAKASGLGLWGC